LAEGGRGGGSCLFADSDASITRELRVSNKNSTNTPIIAHNTLRKGNRLTSMLELRRRLISHF